MVFSGGLLSGLDLLLQKSIRFNHHKQNYERSLFEGIIPTGLKINENERSNQYRVISTYNGTQFYTTRKKAGKVITRRIRESNRDSWSKYYSRDI